MSKFLQYVEDNMLAESCVSSLEREDLLELNEALDEMQLEMDQLNELFGLGKLASKIKNLSDKGDKAVESGKEKAKEVLSTGKDVVRNIAKETVGGLKKNVSEVAKSHADLVKATGKKAVEISGDAKNKLVSLSGQAQSALKAMFSKLKEKELSPEQRKTYEEIGSLFARLNDSKILSGSDTLKILATVLAKSPEPGVLPNYKSYLAALENLRTKPGISSYKFSVKKI